MMVKVVVLVVQCLSSRQHLRFRHGAEGTAAEGAHLRKLLVLHRLARELLGDEGVRVRREDAVEGGHNLHACDVVQQSHEDEKLADNAHDEQHVEHGHVDVALADRVAHNDVPRVKSNYHNYHKQHNLNNNFLRSV